MAPLRTALSRRQLQSEHALQQHGLRKSKTSTCADEAGQERAIRRFAGSNRRRRRAGCPRGAQSGLKLGFKRAAGARRPPEGFCDARHEVFEAQDVEQASEFVAERHQAALASYLVEAANEEVPIAGAAFDGSKGCSTIAEHWRISLSARCILVL
jgi:hypothetical protein